MEKDKKIKKNKLVNWNWIFIVSIMAFIISLGFSFIGEVIIPNVHIIPNNNKAFLLFLIPNKINGIMSKIPVKNASSLKIYALIIKKHATKNFNNIIFLVLFFSIENKIITAINVHM